MFTVEHNVTTGITKQIPFTLDEAKEFEAKKIIWSAGARDRKALEIRAERNVKIAACDWRVLPDVFNNDAWNVYRQALRDVPAQSGFPDDVVWPDEP